MAYPTTLERERELLALAQAGDDAACAELVRLHTPFVRSIVRRFPVFLREDLVAEGVVGLLEAVRRFDVAHDVRFVTYAAHWIRSRMQAYSRSVHRAVGVPRTRVFRLVAARGRGAEDALTHQLGRAPRADELAAALGIHEAELLEARAFFLQGDAPVDPLARVLGDPHAARADELLERHEARGQLTAALERCLSERDRAIVLRYVGSEDATLREVGETYGLSYERVRQIVRDALERLRHDLERGARDESRLASQPSPPSARSPQPTAAASLPPVAVDAGRRHRRRPAARRRCEAPRIEPADGSGPGDRL